MTVVNVDPNKGAKIDANQVPGKMHVYDTGHPVGGTTRYGLSIGENVPTFHDITPGDTDTYTVNNQEVLFYNNGPSKLQLLYGAVQEVRELKGIEEDQSLKAELDKMVAR